YQDHYQEKTSRHRRHRFALNTSHLLRVTTLCKIHSIPTRRSSDLKDNIKELAEKILYLKNNEKVLKDMSEKSIEKIEEKFSIQSVKKKWFEFIENNNITNPNNL